jgi:hypothetical protein
MHYLSTRNDDPKQLPDHGQRPEMVFLGEGAGARLKNMNMLLPCKKYIVK